MIVGFGGTTQTFLRGEQVDGVTEVDEDGADVPMRRKVKVVPLLNGL